MHYSEYFLDLLDLDIQNDPVIAVVGGGGKTSLIYRLCQELTAMDKTVVIATTTHMEWEKDRPCQGWQQAAGAGVPGAI